jgi:toxin secretion/phage lysis holin
MREIWIWIQLAFATTGAFLGWFLGGLDGFLYALIAFVVIDYLTGILCAIVDKKLSSEIGAKGIFKKVLIFALVGVAHILDTQILVSTGNGGVLRTAVIFFYLSNEGVSILENASHIGLPIPKKLKEVLKQLHGSDDEPPKAGDGK